MVFAHYAWVVNFVLSVYIIESHKIVRGPNLLTCLGGFHIKYLLSPSSQFTTHWSDEVLNSETRCTNFFLQFVIDYCIYVLYCNILLKLLFTHI